MDVEKKYNISILTHILVSLGVVSGIKKLHYCRCFPNFSFAYLRDHQNSVKGHASLVIFYISIEVFKNNFWIIVGWIINAINQVPNQYSFQHNGYVESGKQL